MTKRGRLSDEQRVLLLLAGAEGGLSNAFVKNELSLSDERYEIIRKGLLKKALIEIYRCRSGGVRVTPEGEKKAPEPVKKLKSSVSKETDLYEPLCDCLTSLNGGDEFPGIVLNVGSYRRIGKWQNPDVMQIAVEQYKYLKKTKVVLTSYEVKPWNSWSIDVVFEAAAHRRFAHESIVVLEWVNDADFSLSDPSYKVDEIARECQRFGVGLCTLRPWYKSYRLHTHIEAVQHTPNDSAVENWLEYIFDRRPIEKKKYEALVIGE
jgi:hypothetical protein